MRRIVAVMFVITLVIVSGSAACGPLVANAQLGDSKSSAEQIVFDQRLVEVYGEQGAIDRLVQQGVAEKKARVRITNAVAASGKAGQ